MSKVFISYSHSDEEAAHQLAEDLERRGLHVTWIDRLVTPGDSWIPRLQDVISGVDAVLVLISPESVESQWVAQEIAFALAEADKGRPFVVPVLLDPDVEVPFFLRHIQGLDYSKPERAKQQLDALVNSLESGRAVMRDRAAELDARAANLKVTRRVLDQQVNAYESMRAAWSATISASMAALAVVATLVAVAVGVTNLTDLTPGRWVIPFGLGVVASLAVGIIFELIRRRSRDLHSSRRRE